jgi:hypothetical protein
MVLLHQFMGNLGNYDPGHQRRPNVVVDQSFAWITVTSGRSLSSGDEWRFS